MWLPQNNEENKQYFYVGENRPAALTVAVLSGHTELLKSQISEGNLVMETAEQRKNVSNMTRLCRYRYRGVS